MTDVFSGLAGLLGALGDWATAIAASLDHRFGALAPVVAGAAAALVVAIALALYFRKGRSSRDIVRHGAAAIIVLGQLAFVASDMPRAALDRLGITPPKPAVEFEMRLPRTTALALAGETRAAFCAGSPDTGISSPSHFHRLIFIT